jgi:hypothetical protein
VANATEERIMTDASIVAESADDQVLALSLERCLVDGMAPALVVCLVGITNAAHVLRYRPSDLLAEHVGGELVPPINILVVDRIGQSRQIVLRHDDVALHSSRGEAFLCRRAGQDPAPPVVPDAVIDDIRRRVRDDAIETAGRGGKIFSPEI